MGTRWVVQLSDMVRGTVHLNAHMHNEAQHTVCHIHKECKHVAYMQGLIIELLQTGVTRKVVSDILVPNRFLRSSS